MPRIFDNLEPGSAGPATPLMLAWTGVEPELPRQTAGDLRDIEDHDPTVRQARLVARYYTRQGVSCTVTVSTLDSAPLWTIRRGASGRPLTTSMTLSA
jgi:hypothetical protein